MNEVIDQYNAAKQAIFDHVGYVEDWVVIPLSDDREMFWRLEDSESFGTQLRYACTEEDLENESGDFYYLDEIYTQRFLPKWVYRGAEFTIVCCNPGVDGNKFLRILDNTKERNPS
jgi:hypothetical protein